MKRSLGAKTLLFPTPVLLVGTYDNEGKPNLMNAAWRGICPRLRRNYFIKFRST
jgi:flavin reductase (DIM6/NTAB) family NADH-FMN oxidoreductase RutF